MYPSRAVEKCRAALFCAALLAVSLPASEARAGPRRLACEAADLSGHFPDPPCRAQCGVDCCHGFAAVALAEAALFQRTGSKIALSEADLLLQWLKGRAADKGQSWSEFWKGVSTEEHYGAAVSNLEGGLADKSLQLILDNGIIADKPSGFRGFAAGYTRAREDRTLHDFEPEASLSRERGAADGAGRADLARERLLIRRLLGAYKVRRVPLKTAWVETPPGEMAKEEKAGRFSDPWRRVEVDTALALSAELCASRPVAVTLVKGFQSHVLALTGFSEEGGALAFRTRDSGEKKITALKERHLRLLDNDAYVLDLSPDAQPPSPEDLAALLELAAPK
ncbi:MAG: hypothetical protein HY613_08625 [Candidatus Rokubacteria bacterium]|nr:hypothetical protein [Candidatus Rokubacteria bacterium]